MESHPVPGSNDSATGCVDLVVLGVQIRIAGTGMEFEEAMREALPWIAARLGEGATSSIFASPAEGPAHP